MSTARLFFVATAFFGLSMQLAGCAGDAGQASCIEGEVRSCPCAANQEGAQACGDDGTFGECSCFAADAAVDDAGQVDAAVMLACEELLACPAPASDKLTVCGQLIDTETGLPLRTASPEKVCNPSLPSDTGPCALGLEAHDMLTFAGNPEGSTPLSTQAVFLDECGRFRMSNIVPPALGALALVVDDSAIGTTDLLVRTIVGVPGTTPGQTIAATLAATRKTTDESWSASAGNPFGAESFAERGVLLMRFLDGDSSVSGVVATENGSVQAAKDFYFADTDVGATKTTIDLTRDATGPNGSVLFVDTDLVNHAGSGAEPVGCVWPGELTDAVPGTVWVREVGADCP